MAKFLLVFLVCGVSQAPSRVLLFVGVEADDCFVACNRGDPYPVILSVMAAWRFSGIRVAPSAECAQVLAIRFPRVFKRVIYKGAYSAVKRWSESRERRIFSQRRIFWCVFVKTVRSTDMGL